MASLDRLPAELLVMIQDDILAFDNVPDTERALYSVSLTNRRFYFMFNTSLYDYDARHHRKAMAWGAFFGRVDIMKKSRAAGADLLREVAVTPAAVMRALGGFSPRPYPIVLAAAGGQNAVLDFVKDSLKNHGSTAKLHRDALVLLSDGLHMELGLGHYTWWSKPLWSSMYWAIIFNHERTVRHLLSDGVSPILTVQGNVTAMHAAAATGRETMFDLLLSLPGCDLKAKDSGGNTALHYAARGFVDVDLAVSLGSRSCPITGKPLRYITKASTIASLVHRGADIHATNNEGRSPMFVALSKPLQWEAALQLLDLEPADFVPNENLITTILATCARESPGTERMAFFRRILTPATLNRLYHVPGTPLNIGCYRNWHNNAGKKSAPLMWFIIQGCSASTTRHIHTLDQKALKDTFVELLDLGAMPGGLDSRARTPLHACVFSAMTGHHWDLRQPFDFPDKPLGPGDALPEAATKVPFIFIDILLRRGASLEAQDRKGLTPLEYALEKTHAIASRAALIDALAQNVVRLVLLQAWVVSGDFKSPSEDIKRRLVDKLGVGILAPLDPLKGDLDLSEGTN